MEEQTIRLAGEEKTEWLSPLLHTWIQDINKVVLLWQSLKETTGLGFQATGFSTWSVLEEEMDWAEEKRRCLVLGEVTYWWHRKQM